LAFNESKNNSFFLELLIDMIGEKVFTARNKVPVLCELRIYLLKLEGV
jgi:hypothetical protein